MKYLYFLCFLPSVLAITSFNEFKATYNKVYDNVQEEQYRQTVFYENLQMIVTHNSLRSHEYTLKMNEFGDLYSHEFYTSKMLSRKNKNVKSFHVGNLPSSVDWVNQSVVTPAKDQGQCGSCWAFSTTGALEGLYAIENNKLISFSEQQLMDCSGEEGDNSCGGGLMDFAFKYVVKSGICPEDDYPYEARDDTCRKCQSAYRITGYKDVSPNNETELQYAVAKQPVSVAIQADTHEFQFYSDGVFTGRCGTPGYFQLDHGVLAVGYGTENGKDFWYVKNSWGGQWGDNGFIKLERNVKNEDGKCGIALSASYPVNSREIVAFS